MLPALLENAEVVAESKPCKFNKPLLAVMLMLPPLISVLEELITVFAAEIIFPKLLLIVISLPSVIKSPRLVMP